MNRRSRRSFTLALFSLIISTVLSACGSTAQVDVPAESSEDGVQPQEESSEQEASESAEEVPAESDQEAPAEPTAAEDLFAGEGPWEVQIPTSDGSTISGTVYGTGTQGIVLAPMYPGEQAGWVPFAQTASEAGYRVLTFDFQAFSNGTPNELSTAGTDLESAINFLKEYEVEIIAVAGAGQGGTAAALVAASGSDIPRLAVISSSYDYGSLTVAPEQLSSLTIPTLWIGTRQDMQHEVEDMFAQAGSQQKSLWIYEESALHGTYILESLNSGDLQTRLLEFIETS